MENPRFSKGDAQISRERLDGAGKLDGKLIAGEFVSRARGATGRGLRVVAPIRRTVNAPRSCVSCLADTSKEQ